MEKEFLFTSGGLIIVIILLIVSLIRNYHWKKALNEIINQENPEKFFQYLKRKYHGNYNKCPEPFDEKIIENFFRFSKRDIWVLLNCVDSIKEKVGLSWHDLAIETISRRDLQITAEQLIKSNEIFNVYKTKKFWHLILYFWHHTITEELRNILLTRLPEKETKNEVEKKTIELCMAIIKKNSP